LLFKSYEFKNIVGQKIKVIEIPVLDRKNHYSFMIQVRLQSFVTSLYNNPNGKSCYSFRDYLKQKMDSHDFKDLFSHKEFNPTLHFQKKHST
jgi:hypothetical protein